MEHGLVQDDVCNREGCKGVMHEQDNDTSCSCHICPPCSHCVDMIFECDECGTEAEEPEPAKTAFKFKPIKVKTTHERFAELEDDKFGYITIPGKYYSMEYKGKYPKGMLPSDITGKFNICFGYKWISSPSNGKFHLKVYTD